MKKYWIKSLSIVVIFVLILSGCRNNTAVTTVETTVSTDTDHIEALPTEHLPYTEAELAEFDTFCDNIAIDMIASSPLNAGFSYGNLEELGLGHLRSEMDDFSMEAYMNAMDTTRSQLDQLYNYDLERLTTDRQLTYQMLEFNLKTTLADEPFAYYYHNFQPSSGIQVYLPLSLAQIELDNTDEVEAYLLKISKVDDVFDQALIYTYTQAEKDLLMPASLYTTVVEQIEGMITEPEAFMIYQSFVAQVDALELEADQADVYKAQCLEIITNEIFPAYDRIKDGLTEISTFATTNTGVASFENGAEYYEYLLYNKTSYEMSIEDYRSFLNTQIMTYSTRIQALMAKNEVIANLDFMDILPEVTDMNDVYNTQQLMLDEEMPDYGIENAAEHIIPDYLVDYLAAGFYFPVTIDGEDYGNMYLPEDSYTNPDAATIELYFHENRPGHHLYFAHLYESDLPLIRKVLDWLPYEEGWAVYVQGKAYNYMDLGEDLETFLYYVGAVNQYAFALMDLQLHVDGVTYDDMVAYLVSMGYDENGAAETVDRMIANPGESIHYTYGYYKINDYRIQCMEALGEEFDYKSFHEMLLSEGSVPFYLMDDIVAAYIAEEQEK